MVNTRQDIRESIKNVRQRKEELDIEIAKAETTNEIFNLLLTQQELKKEEEDLKKNLNNNY